MRVCAAHTCPLFCRPASSSWGTVAARSASSSTIPADLPPSSRVHRFTISPHTAPTRRPAAVLPVNETLSTAGWATRWRPSSASPGRMLTTPAGTPASTSTSARTKALTGASGDGLSTIGAPAARAAPSFMHVMNSGTFQGTIPTATPTGTFCTRQGPMTPGRRALKAKVSASSANPSSTIAGASTCPNRAKAAGAPISSVMTPASSSARACRPADTRRISSARSAPDVAPHGPSSAAAARCTAASASPAAARGTTATSRWSCGDRTSIVAPVAGVRHAPPTSSCVRSIVISPSHPSWHRSHPCLAPVRRQGVNIYRYRQFGGLMQKRKMLAAWVCTLALVAGACTEDSGGDDAAAGGDGADGGAEIEPSGLLADDGPCDEALAPYPIGIMTVFESPVLSLIDQVDAAEASVAAFNSRGGIGGHCMELTTCDTGLDPNGELDCARQFVDEGVVATVNDTTAANPAGVIETTVPAGLPRVGISPGSEELSAANSYAIGGGAVGTTVMMVPPLARADHTKIALIHVDTPQIQALPALLDPMLDAYGAELTAMIPVPQGTTDYQQFILAAEDAGATGVGLALGEAEAVQVLRAAEQLDTDLVFSTSLGTFAQADAEDFGAFADQLLFNSEVPPVTASTETWPILADVVVDLSASGKDELQHDQIKASAFRSWLAVYALDQVVEQFGDPEDVSREAITAAFEAAGDVDVFGVIPPWTPRGGDGAGIFGGVSNPYYYQVTFDSEAGEFVIGDEQLNVVEELAGNSDYPQPG